MLQTECSLFAGLVLLRAANALLCSTYFQPDEYFQSLEVAHRIVFGYGYETWEWQPESRVRNPFYALLFVPGYWLVKFLRVEDTRLLIWAPKITQAFIAATIDFQTFTLAKRLTNKHVARTALTLSLLSLFNAYVSIRTFSNTFEAALTTATLSKWPFRFSTGSDTSLTPLVPAFVLAALTCIVRPSNALIWLFLGVRLLKDTPNLYMKIRTAASALACGLGVCTVSYLVESAFYRQSTFTPINFFRFNVWQGLSAFYGFNSWNYYFLQGLPILCYNQIPLVMMTIYGTFISQKTQPFQSVARTLIGCCVFTMLGYSLIIHKEVRFVQPLAPILTILAALAVHCPPNSMRPASAFGRLGQWTGLNPRLLTVLAVTSLLPTYYLLQIHGEGQIAVMRYIRSLEPSPDQSIGFLMPCHSTPWQSYLHRRDLDEGSENGQSSKLWALTCEPPISGQDRKTYSDEADTFYEDPFAFLQERFVESFPLEAAVSGSKTYRWPSHLILFDNLLQLKDQEGRTFKDLLLSERYKTVKTIRNGHWQDDDRRTGAIIVLERE